MSDDCCEIRPYGWIYEKLDFGPGWMAGLEWQPAAFSKVPPAQGESRNVIELYDRPSPQKAIDAMRLREFIEREAEDAQSYADSDGFDSEFYLGKVEALKTIASWMDNSQ